MGDEEENREFLAILRPVLKDYIPHQLLKDVNESKSMAYEGIDLVKYYLNNSKNKLRAYGCAQTLMKNLEVYSDFPLRRNRYPVDFDKAENKLPIQYKDMRGEILYCKQDFLFYLQHLAYLVIWQRRIGRKEPNMSEELRKYMKNHRKRLEKCYEFVKFDKKLLDQVCDYLPFISVTEPYEGKAAMTISGIIEYTDEFFIKVFDSLISKYPLVFLPNRETKDKNTTAVVRIFETCGGLRFVMESELFNAINLKNPDQKPLECEDREGYLKTIPMNEVYEKYRFRIDGIHFIRHPVIRTRAAAVPIATPSGDHCIIASDAVMEILHRIISALNIFQKVTPSTWHAVEKYMKVLEKHFPSDMQYLYFINLDLFKKLQMETEEFWKELSDKPVKLIREVGPFGFNFEDIKKELKYLKLHEVFPEITRDLNQLFANIFDYTTPKELKTADMCFAVERCQLDCLYDMLPTLKRIRHYQQLCSSTCCEFCDEVNQKKTKTGAPESAEVRNKSSKIAEFQKAMLEKDMLSNMASVREELLKAVEESEIPEESKKICRRYKKDARDQVQNRMKSLSMDQFQKEMKELKEMATVCRNVLGVKELKMSEEKAKKEMEHLKDENVKLKKENSRILKELKQAEKLKKSHNQMIKEKGNEIDLLKLNISKSSEENKKLSAEISLQKTKEIQMKRSNEELIEKILALQQNVNRLEKETVTLRNDRIQVESRQKLLELEVMEKKRTITELQNSTAQQIKDQIKINQQLQETITIMSTELEEQSERYEGRGKTIKRLLARISSITDPEYSEDNSCPLRRQLMGLRKIKDNLEVRSPLKLAKNISQRLISLSNRPEIQEMATHEYQQFEGKHQMLLQEVIGNIQKLKDSGDVMTFPPLPEYPSFSDQFVNEYWNEIEKQKASRSSEPNSGELQDSECLICFVEMTSYEQTLACDHCRKILHLECAAKWLKIHRSCPHCRREQLDPNEFPALG